MKDIYPDLPNLPRGWLVSPDDQPEYLDLPGVTLDESRDLGSSLCDVHVEAGIGDQDAVVHHETAQTISFARLASLSDAAAAAFHEVGVQLGDRVALRGANCPELIIAAIGAWKIGAAVTLIPALARPDEIDFYLGETSPRLIVVAQPEEPEAVSVIRKSSTAWLISVDGAIESADFDWHALLAGAGPRPAVPTDLDRVAVIWHTGGTTGRPKGCYHTQRRFILGGRSLALAVGASVGQRWAAAAPIGHALGFIHSTNFSLLNGVTLVLTSNFTNPKVSLEAISRHRVTQFTAITATWAAMLAVLDESSDAVELPSLTRGYAMWQSSSATDVSESWRARGIELLNNFGSTAFATWVLAPPLDRRVARAALGVAAPGYDVRAIDDGVTSDIVTVEAGTVGRLAVQGPTGLTYWKLPKRQRADVRAGYTLQDDLVTFDRTGVAAYLGRTDFLISTAGNKVAPVEVEQVLAEHPAVQESVVIGLPDPLRQEIVAAFVVLRQPVDHPDELRRELQDMVKRRLSPYKYPRRIDFVPSVPRDQVGKVQPRVLRERLLAELSESKDRENEESE